MSTGGSWSRAGVPDSPRVTSASAANLERLTYPRASHLDRPGTIATEVSPPIVRPSDAIDAPLEVDIRGRRLPVRIVKYPFVRKGQACIEL